MDLLPQPPSQFYIAETCDTHLEQFYITAYYLHEQAPPQFPVSFKQIPRLDGFMKHPHEFAKHSPNLCDTPNSSRVYITGLYQTLADHEYKQSVFDPFPYTRMVSDACGFRFSFMLFVGFSHQI